MTEEPHDPPPWPPADLELEASIGRFIIAWGVLEEEINLAIAETYRLQDELDLASCITANLGTKAKLEIFQSTVHCLSEFFKPEATKETDKLVNDTATASSKHRNFIAHGKPSRIALHDEDDVWIWGRESARKGGPKVRFIKLHPEYFDTATMEFKALHMRWVGLRREIQEDLKALDFYRREES